MSESVISNDNTFYKDHSKRETKSPVHLVDGDIFNRLSENFDLLVVLQEKSGVIKVINIHPLGTRDIYPLDVKIFH